MVKETLQSFVKDEGNAMQKLERIEDEKELMEEELTNVAAQPKSDPTNQTRTVRRNEYFKLELPEAGATPDSSRAHTFNT
jgi:hypothetical protein